MFVRFRPTADNTEFELPDHDPTLGTARLRPREASALKALQATATSVIKDIYADQGTGSNTVQEMVRVTLAIKNMLPWLPDESVRDPDDLDFTLRCAVAHHRLPDARRLAREASIAQAFDQTLPDRVLRTKLEPLELPMKRCAVLLPDPSLALMVRDRIIFRFLDLCRNDEPVLGHLLKDVLPALMAYRQRLGPDWSWVYEGARDFLTIAFLATEPHDRPALADLANRLLGTPGPHRLFEALDVMHESKRDCPMLLVVPHLIYQLRERTKLRAGDSEGEAELHRFVSEQASKAANALRWQVALVSLNAVLEGVPLGRRYTEAVKHQSTQEQAKTDDAENLVRVTDLRPDAGPAPDPVQRETADLSRVHTWSVHRLLAWIEGPITERAVARESLRQRRRPPRQERQAPAARPTAAQPAPSGLDDMGDGDIDLVVNTALQATADFQLRDLDDLLCLADALRLPVSSVDPCRRAREAMQRIASGQGGGDDGVVCQALASAEAAIAALRAQVRQTQIDEGRRRQFIIALDKALNAEPLVRGKRHGGVIECPLPPTLWGWVNAEFNGQWIAGATHLEINGRPVPLRPNEALALYVTGSSLSGHAFDISVHLWQRRGGHSGPPCADAAGLRLMNRDDWFDTHVPCAVLHVPLGQ